MNTTAETYNETYNKPTNLSNSCGKLEGNIYVSLLLLIITLRFTSGKRKFWWMINKFQNMIKVACLEMALMGHGIFSLTESISFNP